MAHKKYSFLEAAKSRVAEQLLKSLAKAHRPAVSDARRREKIEKARRDIEKLQIDMVAKELVLNYRLKRSQAAKVFLTHEMQRGLLRRRSIRIRNIAEETMLTVLEKLTRIEKGLLAIRSKPVPAKEAIELYGVALYIADAMAIAKRKEPVAKVWENTGNWLRSEIDALGKQLKENKAFKTKVKSSRLWSIAMQGGNLVSALEEKAGIFVEIGFKEIHKAVDKEWASGRQ